MSRIVIVGGGASGLEMASLLGRGVSRHDEVILIEGERRHYWKPRLHEVAAGTFDQTLDSLCYRSHSAKHGYQYCQAWMTDVDRVNKQIIVREPSGIIATLDYDYLIIAIGATSNDFAIPGVQAHCLCLDSTQHARNSWQRISALLGSGEQSTINIVGSGPTGVELAAELAEIRTHFGTGQGTAKLQINLIEAADRVLPGTPQRMSQLAQRKLQQLGVNLLLNTRIASVNATSMITADGDVLTADAQFWASGVKAPDWLQELAGLQSNAANQLVVEQTLVTTRDSAIFALGDCAAIPQPGGHWVPAKAQAADRAAQHLVKNLLAHIAGRPLRPFVYKDAGTIISIGHNFAIGALFNERVILQGWVMRRLYDTIFRLHQRTVSGLSAMSTRIVAKRINLVLNPLQLIITPLQFILSPLRFMLSRVS